MKKETIICEDLQRNKVEVAADQLVFRPAVYGVLIEEGRVLLSKQWDGYDLPGGSFELTETIDQALEREFFEETGLRVRKGKLLDAVSSFFVHPYKKIPYNCILLYYTVQRVGGELSTANFDEHEKQYAQMPEWIEVDRVNALKFYNPVETHDIVGRALEVHVGR